MSGSSRVVVLLLSGIVSRLRPLLGCLGSGCVLSSPPPPSSWSLPPLFAVALEARVTLLARCWHATGLRVELSGTAQNNRTGRCWAVVGFAPSTRLLLPGSVWIVLRFCPPCLDHTRYLVETRPVPGSSWSCQVASRSPRRSRPSSCFRPGLLSRFTLCPTRVVSICLRPAR